MNVTTQYLARQVLDRANEAYQHQVMYNQDGTFDFGLGVQYRCDCSGSVCAYAGITPSGIDCPSTYELRHGGYTSGPISRDQINPGQTVVLVTNEDGHPFGHVGLIYAYDRGSDQVTIQEHGGRGDGYGPIRRTMAPGVTYDSSRNFQLYQLLNVHPTTIPAPPIIDGDTMSSTEYQTLSDQVASLRDYVNQVSSRGDRNALANGGEEAVLNALRVDTVATCAALKITSRTAALNS